MPSASSRARSGRPSGSASALVGAGIVLLVVGLVVVAIALLRGNTPAGGGTGPSAAVPTRSGAAVPKASVDRSTPRSGLQVVAESALPAEAGPTLALVRDGGPFPYAEDGDTFGNRERILPRRATGYYREYTVDTPGEDDRGPRRIVAGAEGDLYWTADHYASFRQIEEGR